MSTKATTAGSGTTSKASADDHRWRLSVRFRLALLATAAAIGLVACSSDDDEPPPPVSQPATGVFDDAPVEGLQYRTATQSGMTNARGEFRYIDGETVTFSIGGLDLGSAVVRSSNSRVTPAHLVPAVAGDVTKISNLRATNVSRFLQSLGTNGQFESGITISPNTAAIIAKHAAGINFDAAEAAFGAQPSVQALFTELGNSLRSGPQARNHLRRTMLGIRKLTDVRIPMRDGSYLLADVFMPIEAGQYPVILTASAYGKAFVSGCTCTPAAVEAKAVSEDQYFEKELVTPTPGRYEVVVSPNTVQWIPKGFVLIRLDTRGTCNSLGTLFPYSAQEALDNYDAIEWAAKQPWANGNVGMWGLSNSASLQMNVASLQPPSLKAMISNSNDPDQYRDIVFPGGIYHRDYRESWFAGSVAGPSLRCMDQPYVDIVSTFRNNRFQDAKVYGPIATDPVTNEQLPTGQVTADLSKINIPVWSIHRQDIWPVHMRGPINLFKELTAPGKRLTVEVGDEFSKAYSTPVVDLYQRFFHKYLGGGGNTDLPPAVTIEYRHPDATSTTEYADDWPLARTQYVKYFLDAINPNGDGAMSLSAPASAGSTTYSADVGAEVPSQRLACTQYGVNFVSTPMTQDTMIAGHMKLGLTVSSTSTDMDIHATLRVVDQNGAEVFYHSFNSQKSPVAIGLLKVSHRKQDPARRTDIRPYYTHAAADHQPLTPGQPVQAEVEIWPATALVKAGHRLMLTIQPYTGCFAAVGGPNGVYLHEYDTTYHVGASNTIHTGGAEPSYLQIAVVPPKP